MLGEGRLQVSLLLPAHLATLPLPAAFTLCVLTYRQLQISLMHGKKKNGTSFKAFLEKAGDRTVQWPLQLPLSAILFKLSLTSLKIQKCKRKTQTSSVGKFSATLLTWNMHILKRYRLLQIHTHAPPGKQLQRFPTSWRPEDGVVPKDI